MTDPFDPVRAAVASFAAVRPIAGPTPSTPAGVLGVFQPVVAAVARLNPILGHLVAVFPAVGYARWLDYLAVECSVVCPVDVYYGQVSPASRLSSHGDGSLADYDPSTGRYVPEGTPVLVRWRTGTGTAAANAQFRQVI